MSGVDGTWDPGGRPAAAPLPDAATLARLAAAGAVEEPDPAAELSPAEQQALAAGTRAGLDAWSGVAATLDAAMLVGLVRFYTVAEAVLPGWDAGDASPVIALARELRRREAWPADLRAWIRARSANRFLPWGNLLHRL